MGFYILCDCGTKNRFEHRGFAPRKCENKECGRSLIGFSVIDEDFVEKVNVEETEECPNKKSLEDIALDSFFYSLDTIDGTGQIVIPASGGIIGRDALGADILENHLAVSKNHMKVGYRGRIGLLIEDMSRYGTFINDEQLVKGITKFVHDGDVIKLYDFELIVKRHEEG